MFNLKADWNHPAKPADRESENILRIKLSPKISAPDKPLALFFALDVSKSMSGDRLNKAKDIIRKLINRLSPADRYFICVFSDEAKETALSEINDLSVSGVTRTDLALKWMSGKMPQYEQYSRTGIILSDGLITNEYGKQLTETSQLKQSTVGGSLIALCLGKEDITLMAKLTTKIVHADTADEYCGKIINLLQETKPASATSAVVEIKKIEAFKITSACVINPAYTTLTFIDNADNTEIIVNGIEDETDVLLKALLNPLNFGDEPGMKDVMSLKIKGMDNSTSVKIRLDYKNVFTDQPIGEKSIQVDVDRWDSMIADGEKKPPTTPVKATDTSDGFGVD